MNRRLNFACVVVFALALFPSAVRAAAPEPAEHAYAAAIRARAQGDYHAAASHLREAVQFAPGNLEYRLTLGETLAWAKRLSRFPWLPASRLG